MQLIPLRHGKWHAVELRQSEESEVRFMNGLARVEGAGAVEYVLTPRELVDLAELFFRELDAVEC